MKKISILIIFISSIYAQGYIDQDSVMRTFPEYQLAQNEIKLRQQELTDTFELMVKAFEDYTHQHRNIPAEIEKDTMKYRLYIAQLENELATAQATLDTYGAYASKELEKLELKWHTLLQNKLKISVEYYCKQFQVPALFDKQSLLYCPSCKDHTTELIKFISK